MDEGLRGAQPEEREDHEVSEKLKPCPFCGGEAHLVDDYSSEHDHTFYQVWHDCTTNPGTIRHAYGHALSLQISTPWCANEKDAVLLWNRRDGSACEQRRTRRTCNVKSSYMEWETGDYSYLEVELSCGHAFTWDDGTPPDYCPYCGAKVVSK